MQFLENYVLVIRNWIFPKYWKVLECFGLRTASILTRCSWKDHEQSNHIVLTDYHYHLNCCFYSAVSMLSMKGMTVSICTLPIRPAKKISSNTSCCRERRGERRSKSFENRELPSGFVFWQCERSSDTAWSQIRSKYEELSDSWSELIVRSWNARWKYI